jgi:hypothetical protein
MTPWLCPWGTHANSRSWQEYARNIQDLSKLNSKTLGMNSSYRETKRVWQHGSRNVWLQSSPSVYLLSARRHVLIAGINCKTTGYNCYISIQVTSYKIMQLTELCDLLVRLVQFDSPNTVTLNMPVTPAETLCARIRWNVQSDLPEYRPPLIFPLSARHDQKCLV